MNGTLRLGAPGAGGKSAKMRLGAFWAGVARLVGIEGGVVSGVFNLESSDVGASDRRPRHDDHYHEALSHALRATRAWVVSGVHRSFRPLPTHRTCAPTPR